jgi:oxygen-independent coproporphyrinogen-3 oxidase
LTSDPGTRDRWLEALVSEVRTILPENLGITTLYAGGGTPTLLPPLRWRTFMEALRGRVDLSGLEESTIEVNPATCTAGDLAGLRETGFDRMSVGVQSFGRRELALLGRIHTVEQAERVLEDAACAGFDSISIDLIYGIPGQTEEDWQQSLDRALDHAPGHLSVYDLTLDGNTPMAAAGPRKPADDFCAGLYHQAHLVLTGAGYEHYEVSSYALGGSRRSKHNCGYWNRSPYSGLGPSAHSFDGEALRWWNTPDLDLYLRQLEGGGSPVEERETLTREQQADEMLMLGMRWAGGFDTADLENLGCRLGARGEDLIARLSAEGHAEVEGTRVVPTVTGMLLADGIAAGLSSCLSFEPAARLRGTGASC